jgi:hypothetical protein
LRRVESFSRRWSPVFVYQRARRQPGQGFDANGFVELRLAPRVKLTKRQLVHPHNNLLAACRCRAFVV